MDMSPQLKTQKVQLKIRNLKTSLQAVSLLRQHPRLAILAPEALWPARAKTTPLGLIVVCNSLGPQPGLMVRSDTGTKHCEH